MLLSRVVVVLPQSEYAQAANAEQLYGDDMSSVKIVLKMLLMLFGQSIKLQVMEGGLGG